MFGMVLTILATFIFVVLYLYSGSAEKAKQE
jgi:hypothetical protein